MVKKQKEILLYNTDEGWFIKSFITVKELLIYIQEHDLDIAVLTIETTKSYVQEFFNKGENKMAKEKAGAPYTDPQTMATNNIKSLLHKLIELQNLELSDYYNKSEIECIANVLSNLNVNLDRLLDDYAIMMEHDFSAN